jgi:hypothetical protein
MTQLQKVLGIIAVVVGILGGTLSLVTKFQEMDRARIKEAVERVRDREHLRAVEEILMREHPNYAADIPWDNK